MLKAFTGLSLQDRVANWAEVIINAAFNFLGSGKSTLLGINTEALSDELLVDTINMLDETRNWWKNLLSDVPFSVDLALVLLVENFIRMVGLVSKLWVLLGLVKCKLANDIGDEVVHEFGLRFTLRLQSLGDCNMGLSLDV